jgi:basic membrane lipoprotein Med (substrate-binding protein (PBP1-ABC) superfamily)
MNPMHPVLAMIFSNLHPRPNSQPRQEWGYGLAEGGVKLAPFGKMVPRNVRSFVEEKQEEIIQKKLAIFSGMSDEEAEKDVLFRRKCCG